MKPDTLFKRAYNDTLELLAKIGRGGSVPSENALRTELGVSRTTVRKVLAMLEEKGAIQGPKKQLVVRTTGKAVPRFAKAETVATADQVEQRFMEWMLRDNAKPGTVINELDLARQFGVATTGIREFLNRFQRFGLIEKRAHGGWFFKGFTQEFALELFEIREMFEVRSAKAFAGLTASSPLWNALATIRDEHLALLKNFEGRYLDFSDLDRRFHILINSAAPNRFIQGFYDVISLIFHYHYQWNKKDEKQRNRAAAHEHLAYIEALMTRSPAKSEQACRAHLRSARTTLLTATASIEQ